ncbi:hypothetical protein CCR75_007266 [Bremia lactucae]|uniref:Uncharacterized protein n=1 Tax=Bremia lactucae TaxID=4779 RepID=A0A976FS35_BRELC|nr:hypothetical protein CCR75_007266 [Bremia lactucae]
MDLEMYRGIQRGKQSASSGRAPKLLIEVSFEPKLTGAAKMFCSRGYPSSNLGMPLLSKCDGKCLL